MKRKYKKALQDCFEPPAPQRKAQFLQKIQAEQSQDTATPLFFQRYPKSGFDSLQWCSVQLQYWASGMVRIKRFSIPEINSRLFRRRKLQQQPGQSRQQRLRQKQHEQQLLPVKKILLKQF